MGCGTSTAHQHSVMDSPGINTRILATKPAGPFEVEKGDVPKCPPKGLVVKTEYSGLCHSDVHIWQNQVRLSDDLVVGMEVMSPGFTWPAVLGHEICGVVHAVGAETEKDAPKLKVGERVVVFSWIGCGDCGWCESGKNNFCANSFSHDIGVANDGGFQAYVAIRSKKYVVKLPDEIKGEEACLFGCSAITAYNACLKAKASIERALKTTGEAKFLVVGAGGLGLWAVQIAKAMFPAKTKIYIASAGEDKLTAAKQLGACESIEWPREGDDNAVIEKTKAVTGGIDGAIDTVSIATTLHRVLQCTNKGATIVAPGMSGGIFPLPLLMLTLRDVTLTGVYTGNPEEIQEFVSFYTKHKLRAPPIQKITPEQVDETMRKLHEGTLLGRAVIEF